MSSEIKIYKMKDLIRKNESGEIDFERSIRWTPLVGQPDG